MSCVQLCTSGVSLNYYSPAEILIILFLWINIRSIRSITKSPILKLILLWVSLVCFRSKDSTYSWIVPGSCLNDFPRNFFVSESPLWIHKTPWELDGWLADHQFGLINRKIVGRLMTPKIPSNQRIGVSRIVYSGIPEICSIMSHPKRRRSGLIPIFE